jgi:glycosyltransferase involved in cell wall biosynthesis
MPCQDPWQEKVVSLLYITDWNIHGSGYFSIGASLVPALTKARTEPIIVLGINYHGQEYTQTDFTIVPTLFEHIPPRIIALLQDKELNLDKVVVALDLPLQLQLLAGFPRQQRPFRYVGIFPLDGGPLVREWAAIAGEMNDAFVISQFAQKCCHEAGVEVNYLPIGVTGWFVHAEPGFPEEIRQRHGVADKFIILTVADNQERKNLSGAMEMVARFAKDKPDVEHWIVTRMQSRYGWQLETLARQLGIRHITHFFDRNLDPQLMFLMYCSADVLLLTSKAEGLGMPVLEAQMVGHAIPIVTRTSALVELIEQGCGLFIEPDYHWIDPFGNTERVFPSVEDGVRKLEMVYNASDNSLEWMREYGRRFMSTRTWDKAAEVFWDVMDRHNPSTIGYRSRVPWYFGSEDLQFPDFAYEDEYRGR